jgi:hypothetical protein
MFASRSHPLGQSQNRRRPLRFLFLIVWMYYLDLENFT